MNFQGVHLMFGRTFILFTAFCALLMWPGCRNTTIVDPGPGQTADKAAITRMIQSDSLGQFELSDEAVMDDGAPIFDDGDGALAKILTTIKPIRWGKKITSVVRNVDIVITGDTVALATITKIISGNLVISAAYSDTATVAD